MGAPTDQLGHGSGGGKDNFFIGRLLLLLLLCCYYRSVPPITKLDLGATAPPHDGNHSTCGYLRVIWTL